MTRRKIAFIVLLMFTMTILCSCAKKKVEQMYGPANQNQAQSSVSQSDSQSPEMLPQPIEIPPSQSPGLTGNVTATESLKKFEDEDIYFNFDDFTISEEGKNILASKADFLRSMQSLKVIIEGHCDDRGTTEYNLALGEKRAREVRKYLISLGIDGNRLSVISYGKEKPAAKGQNEAAWAKNRRAHLDAFEK
ncbi:MAG TPA: peptidoglycan-associated lipoprotein Pal [Desulfomonilia bacterium]|jgi:peptidoglycan-associated lipoprotein